MAETIVKPEVVRSVPIGEGAVQTTAVAWTANLTEKAIHIPLGVGRVARAEVFRAASAGVDWLESVSQSQFKVGRELVHQLDKLTLEFVDGLESLVLASTAALRRMGEETGKMVSKTAATLTRKGERPANAV